MIPMSSISFPCLTVCCLDLPRIFLRDFVGGEDGGCLSVRGRFGKGSEPARGLGCDGEAGERHIGVVDMGAIYGCRGALV